MLVQPAAAIRVGHVVRDTEGTSVPAECFLPACGSCSIATCCRLKGALAEAVQAFYAVLDHYTLADIAGNQHELAGILHFHKPAAAAAAAA